jgi:hypothetical protein
VVPIGVIVPLVIFQRYYAIFVVVTFVATFWFLNPKIVHGLLKFANPNQKNFIFGLMASSESTLHGLL